jgi:predicted PurR-regulated permease PerM
MDCLLASHSRHVKSKRTLARTCWRGKGTHRPLPEFKTRGMNSAHWEMIGMDEPLREARATEWRFVRRTLIVIGLVALVYGIWLAASVLPLIFAAILLATLLDWFADGLMRLPGISKKIALTAASLIVGSLLIGFLVVFGSQIGGQLSNVFQKLPQAVHAIGEKIGVLDANFALEEALSGGGGGRSVLTRAASLGYTLIGGLGDLALVLVGAVYLAADPGLYRSGLVKMFSQNQHERIRDAMNVTGAALQLWFGGQLLTMLIVGPIAGLSFWWIGLPSPLALGLIAAMTNFVPYLGPVIGALPALVFALTMDLTTFAWTLGAILLLQQIEGNVVTPIIQSRAVDLPPALALFSILVFGLLFGLSGVLLAAPASVAALVLVKMLWVRDALGERTHVPGEDVAK